MEQLESNEPSSGPWQEQDMSWQN